MVILLTGLALITFIAAALLAIVRAGIRRQERCRCLTCQPPTLAAAITRRLVGMQVQRPFPGACHDHRSRELDCDKPLRQATSQVRVRQWPRFGPQGPSARSLTDEYYVVGVAGFEPAASSSRTKRAAKLRYTPATASKV
jgi:hypothetical protein